MEDTIGEGLWIHNDSGFQITINLPYRFLGTHRFQLESTPAGPSSDVEKTVSGDASPLSKEEDEADEAEADEGDEAVSSVLRGRGFSLGMVISGWLGRHKGDFMCIQCGLNENF